MKPPLFASSLDLYRLFYRLSIGDRVLASLVGPMLLSWMFSLARQLPGMWELVSSRIYATKCLRGRCGRRCGSFLAWSSFPSPPTHHPVRLPPGNPLRSHSARSTCRRYSIVLPHAPLSEWKVPQWAPRWSRFSSEWAFPAVVRLVRTKGAQCAFDAR